MTRELAQRISGGNIVTLIWNDDKGHNETHLAVMSNGRQIVREIEPTMSWFAFTHAGSFIPEAFQKEVAHV